MSKRGMTRIKIYDYIRSRISSGNTSPTVREICSALGLRSPSTVHGHLEKLRDDGYITFEPLLTRSILLTNRIPPESEAFGLNSSEHDTAPAGIGVPLVGKVAAGSPVLAFDDYETRYVLPKRLLRGSSERDTFLLTVDGDSMVEAGILTGDMIIVSRTMEIEDGDIVVARVFGDSATVKRLYREDSRVRLQPENPLLEPIYVDNSDVEIIGRVIGLIRSY